MIDFFIINCESLIKKSNSIMLNLVKPMYEFFIETDSIRTKKFYITDKNNNPVFECKKTGFIMGYSIKNIKDDQDIAVVKYHQQFIIPGFKIILKNYKSKIKVRESFLHYYVVKGSNIGIKKGDDLLTYVFVEDTKILADLSISIDNTKLYKIKVYDESKINIIISMVLGLRICIYMSV